MIRFDGRVAIVTGAGNGLGRSHAPEAAARGAGVVVNDLGGARDGSDATTAAAEEVVAEIRAAGGVAMASATSVTDAAAIQVHHALVHGPRHTGIPRVFAATRGRTFR